MNADATTRDRSPAADNDLLSWENLGACAAGRAFRQSMAELLFAPRRFFGRMALSGGLYEPVTFFALVVGMGVALAFPAALAYVGLTAPDPTAVTPSEYDAYSLPAKVTGLLVVVLPLVLVVGSAVMVVLGTLFHSTGRLFGSGNWEGSISIWLYSCSAALAPVILAVAGVLLVSLPGYLLSTAWPGVRPAAAAVAHWATVLLVGFSILGGLALVVLETFVGCTRAFGLDGTRGAAAALSGVLFVAAVIGVCIWGFAERGLIAGLLIIGVCALAAVAVTAISVVRSRYARGVE